MNYEFQKSMKHTDPMGQAILDYHRKGMAARLRVFSPQFEEDEMPLETLFRSYDDMPHIEQTALQMAKGKILDVGAGAGCHSLALQQMGKDVTAIDLSPLSVQTMKERGVKNATACDFYRMQGNYDTLLMLMNGTGIIGNISNMAHFFAQTRRLLNPGGSILIDSTDIRYVFENEDGSLDINLADGYYGELQYAMQYKNIKGNAFPWLYIDFPLLHHYAQQQGFSATLIEEGEEYNYLCQLKDCQQ